MKIFRGVFETLSEICDGAFCENHALCDLVSFVQFKIMKNTHGGVLLLVLKVALLRGCFSRFLNCTNGTKSLKNHIMTFGLNSLFSHKAPSQIFNILKFNETQWTLLLDFVLFVVVFI